MLRGAGVVPAAVAALMAAVAMAVAVVAVAPKGIGAMAAERASLAAAAEPVSAVQVPVAGRIAVTDPALPMAALMRVAPAAAAAELTVNRS